MTSIRIYNGQRKASFPHLMHFILTIFTFGAWLPVWILHRLFSGR